MAETTVRTPDGEVVVRHPEGASRGQILRFAKMQYEQQADEPTLAELDPGEYDPSSPEFRAKYGAASTGTFDNLAAGAGKFLSDRWRGAGQLLGITPQEEIDQARARDADLMRTKSGLAGNILGGAAFTAPLAAIPGVGTGLGAAALGAAIGASEPVATGESRGVNAALGAAGGFAGQRLGQVLGGGRGQADDLVTSSLNRAERRALVDAERLGFRATPGQASGSRPLRQLEAALESKPFTSGPISAIKSANQRQANQIVAKSIGEIDDEVSSDTLGRAFNRMSQQFSDFADSISARPIDTPTGKGFLNGLYDEFDDLTNVPLRSEGLLRKLDKLVESGQASGRQLRNLTSKLGRKANTQMTSASGDRELGLALYQAKEFVDDIIEAGLDGADSAAYRTLRDQYRAYSLITSRQSIINPSSGNVNLNALASALQSKDKTGFLRGGSNSDLITAARFGQAFKPIVGDSGTATRSVGALEFLAGAPFNVASRAYFSPASTAIAATGNQTLKNVGSVLGPAADPRLLGLLGASAATSK